MPNMWLVNTSVEQGEWLRCFVQGTDDPDVARQEGLKRLGVSRPVYLDVTPVDAEVRLAVAVGPFG